MKLAKIKVILRDNGVDLTNVDLTSLTAEFNEYENDIIESKKIEFEAGFDSVNLKKEAVSAFLKENGFDNLKAFKDNTAAGTDYKEKYETMYNEKRKSSLNDSIKSILGEYNIEEKHLKLVSKLLSQEGLYNDTDELQTEILKTNIASVLKEDLGFLVEETPETIGVELTGVESTPNSKIDDAFAKFGF